MARSDQYPLGLYRGLPGHARGSDTSRAAAEAVTQLTQRQRLVLATVRAEPGTVWQILDRLGWPYHLKDSIAPRLTELRRAGLIEDSGTRAPSPHGRLATIWRAT